MTQAQARMEAGRAALSAILAGWPARMNPCDETYQPPEAGTTAPTGTHQLPPAPTRTHLHGKGAICEDRRGLAARLQGGVPAGIKIDSAGGEVAIIRGACSVPAVQSVAH